MAVRLTVLCGVLFLSICALRAQDKPAAEKAADTGATAKSGKQTYNHYCAACHGAAARGDGPVAGALTSPVPDLSTLAKRHGGKANPLSRRKSLRIKDLADYLASLQEKES